MLQIKIDEVQPLLMLVHEKLNRKNNDALALLLFILLGVFFMESYQTSRIL